jgi:hypothetical protein
MPVTEIPLLVSAEVFTVISCGVDPAAVPHAAARRARAAIAAIV